MSEVLRRLLRLLLSFAILVAAMLIGRGLVWLSGLPIPSSLVGMVLLLVALFTGLVKLPWVEASATLLLGTMAVFFVPPAVSLVSSLDVLAHQWLPLLVGAVITTLLVLTVVGVSEQHSK